MLFQKFQEVLSMFIAMHPNFTWEFLIIAKIFGALIGISTPLTLLSGALLGTFWGTIVAIVGNTIGAMLCFVVARFFLKDYVQNKLLPKYPKIKEYEERLFKNGFSTIIFFRLVPIFPFTPLNYLLAITNVSFKDYFWGTFLGIIPGTLAFVYFGESLHMLNFYKIAIAIASIIALGFISKFWKI